MDRNKEPNDISISLDEAHSDTFDFLSPVQEFLQDQNHCCLCGSALSFKHQIDHLTLTLIEDAKCESCHISLRSRNHTLQ